MNETVIVANTTKEAFELALRLVFLDNYNYVKNSNEKEYKCIGYKIENNKLFLSKYSEKCTLFPYEFNIQQTIDFAWGWWLKNQNPTDEEPDTDGSTEVAWMVSTKDCGVGSEDWGMFVSVEPIWFEYGK